MGYKKQNKEKITCIAIRGVDVSIDVEDDQFKNLMEKEYHINIRYQKNNFEKVQSSLLLK